MKISRIKFLFAMMIVLTISINVLTGCGGEELSSDFDEEQVRMSSESVITKINDHDGDALREISSETMERALTDDTLEQIFNTIEEAGEFEKIENTNIIGNREDGEEFAVAIAKVKYENQSFTYTISFNKQMDLAGLYYK